MARWTPDPSFYPSPGSAAAADPRRTRTSSRSTRARTATGRRTRWPCWTSTRSSSTYGQVVGRLDLPNVGDELHHFGWNACSAALCPQPCRTRTSSAATCSFPACARRASTSSTPSPTRAQPQDRQDDRAGGDRTRKTGYSRAAHRPLRPRRDLRQRARRARRRRAGRRLPARPHELRGQGRVGGGPRAAAARLRLLVAPRPRHDDHQRVGHAEHGRERREPRAAARQASTATAPRLGSAQARNHSRRSISAPSTRWCWSCDRPTTPTRPTASSASSPA